ncbi:MAG: T9SS type A sorting domain-containing protein [Bacteroidales bacterium]|nr:T9SS type A sorting domain-containing protein [Bacteroidales bacterium]
MRRISLLGLSFVLCFGMQIKAQGILTGLGGNDVVKMAAKKAKKMHKSDTLLLYEPIWLPLTDDFSAAGVYPDTALWLNRQGFVNQSFCYNPPTIGCLTLDAVDSKGKIYEHASVSPFGADTLLSRPIRMDSIPISPSVLIPLSPADSVYFSFYYQPGGGLGAAWEALGNSPETDDSLVLEFAYQTPNIVLLYYIYDTVCPLDTVQIGDTIFSPCDSGLFIIAQQIYAPFDSVAVPCDSVCAMETIWETVWATQGMKLKQFFDTYNTYFRQIMIPITDPKYFNSHFQFRFRNYASLDDSYAEYQSNCDFWNLDYIRLSNNRTCNDTAINDLAIVDNPGSILEKYTFMPWQHFVNNSSSEIKSGFELKLTNLFNQTKNSMYQYIIYDDDSNTVGTYNGGNQNIDPFVPNGYQTASVHAQPPMPANLTLPSATKDSVLLTIAHIFRDQGNSDVNSQNDTAFYWQKFYNYFAYDDGTPEAGYVVISTDGKRTTGLALTFQLNKADTIQAVDIYFNNVYNNATEHEFDLCFWNDEGGKPGQLIYKQTVNQIVTDEIYGFQRFYLDTPFVHSGTIFTGYQTYKNKFLNIGFDQNNSAAGYYFVQKNGGTWLDDYNFSNGTPMIRLVVGKTIEHTDIQVVKDNEKPDFVLYPNPANDRLYITTTDQCDVNNWKISIYNITGQTVLESDYEQQISVSHLSSGFYILKLTYPQNGQSVFKKFVIQ